MCREVEVTEKEIVCLPPDEQPDSLTGKAYPRVVVSVGNKQVVIGFLRYEYTFWDNDPFRYAVFGGIGGLILVIILIVLCCCCCCRRKKKADKNPVGMETGFLTNSSKGSNYYSDFKGNTST